MSIIDGLTPKHTEEYKPDFFVQKTARGYRQINPLAWNGKIRYREQLKTVFNIRTIFTIALILFIAYNYFENTNSCAEFQSDPCIYLQNLTNYCRDNQVSEDKLFFGDLKDGESNTNTLQGFP